MKIAITYDGGNVFQHFGHTAQFKIYEIQGERILSAQVVDTCGSGHGALAGFLAELGIDVLICGGIGGGARIALEQAGIQLFAGVHGDADEAAEQFAAGTLEFDPCARCDHHGHAHNCGTHSCGSHSCQE